MADRTHSHDTSTPAMSDETVPSEEAAKLVYEAMVWARDQQPGVPVPKWIDGGNSDAQYEARRVIRKIADLSASHLAKEGGEAWAVEAAYREGHGDALLSSMDVDTAWDASTAKADLASHSQPSPALAKGGDAVRLLPCPFCGGEPTLHPHSPDHKLGAWASCSTCGLESPTETGQSVEVAVQHWNTRAALTDHSTRPADPAAPVAEAGDGEVVAWEARFAEAVEIAQDKFAWKAPLEVVELQSDLLALLRDYAPTLEAERARADAAEQRAADALARAEKAEGEIAEAERREKWELEQAKINRRHHDAKVHSYVIAELGIIRIKLAEARVSREAQPATDGGDNG